MIAAPRFRTWRRLIATAVVSLAGCATGNHLPPYPHPPAYLFAPPTGSTPTPRATLTFAPAPEPAAAIQQTSTVQEELPNPTGLPVPADPPGMPLDLPGALKMAAGSNLQIALANERIQEAYARQQAAKVLWLPSLRAGTSYDKHDGRLQDVEGFVRDVSRSSLQTGAGVGAVGAGTTTVPGLVANFHTKDALFQPKINQQLAFAEQSAGTAATNDTLLSVALGYLDLLEAYQARAIARNTADKAAVLADLTANFAAAGKGLQADADRAATELAVRKNAIWQAEERVRVASAHLAELLKLDPTVPIQVQEETLFPLNLVPCTREVRELIALGLANRPELAESRHLVTAALNRLRQEKAAPWLPSVLLGASYTGFGGSPGGAISNFNDRLDVNGWLYWEVRNLGFGEKAFRASADSRLKQAQIQELQRLDRVARQVVEAHVQVQSRQQQIAIAEQAVRTALAALQRNLERIRNNQGLPIEVLQSIQALDQSQREYLRTLADYNRAQFQLNWAVGWAQTP